MSYTTASDVRELSQIGSAELDNATLESLGTRASKWYNQDVNVTHDERITYISSYRENDINGSNTEFFTKEYPIGDRNYDFSVGTADVEAYTLENTTRTTYSVSSIDDELGKVTLSSAPSASEALYLKYVSVPVEYDHPMVEMTVTTLACGLAVLSKQGRSVYEYKLGPFKQRKAEEPGSDFFNAYERLKENIQKGEISIGKAKQHFDGSGVDLFDEGGNLLKIAD